MSNFICPYCKHQLIDSAGGYVAGCDHFPLENANEAEYFSERAGIYEYDAGLNRRRAEKKAMRDVLEQR